ncbi:uncharacterized protein LOC135463896 [Liolophura sinensis]|uniref:uncharacterized protein LOC135463896 n=1 Tax=Liolophura sinensis TaxID=3198878 RepID=UPI003158DA6B
MENHEDIEALLAFGLALNMAGAQRVKDVAVSAAVAGKAALEQEDFSKAEDNLRKARLLFSRLPQDENKDAMGDVLKNLIMLHQKKGNIPKALQVAQERLALLPMDFYSPWLTAKIMLQVNELDKALDLFCISFNLSKTEDQHVDSLVEVVDLLYRTKGQNADRCDINASSSIWKKVIKRLSEAKKWDLINTLLGLSPVKCTVLDGKARGCGAEGVNLGLLMDSLRDRTVTTWQQNLAVALLKDGAPLETIRGSFNNPPIHVALAIGLRSGCFQLLEYILEKSTLREVNQLDSNGDSTFHVIVKSGKAHGSEGQTAVRLLVRHGGRSDIRDRHGKLATEYVSDLMQNTEMSQSTSEDIFSRLEMLREKGKRCMATGDYAGALRHYTQAIGLVDESEALCPDAAIFYSNRSAAFNKQGDLTNALNDAETCIRKCPEWPKGYWRKGQILRARGDYLSAFFTFWAGYECQRHADDALTCLVDATYAMSQIKDFQPCLEKLEMAEKPALSSAIKILSERSEWWALKLLMMGPGSDQGSLTKLVQGVSAKGVNLGGLMSRIEAISHATESWPYYLLCTLLSLGASPSSMAANTPYHVAVQVALRMNDMQLLDIVLRNPEAKMGARLAQDAKGGNLLHTLCTSSATGSLICTKIADVLLGIGVNPRQRDQHGKVPSDYLPLNSELRQTLSRTNTVGV